MTTPTTPAAASPRTAQQEQALAIYLNDHLAAATAGVELAKRAAAAEEGSPLGPPLAALAAEIAADREALKTMMSRLRVRIQTYKVGAGWVAEKAGRLKLNGSWLSRSPLAPVIETDGLAMGIEGKAALWRTLRSLAAADQRIDVAELDQLLSRAAQHAEVVERLRRQAAATAFGGPV
jgi:predicted DNA-binding ribbon-helix-helix protein